MYSYERCSRGCPELTRKSVRGAGSGSGGRLQGDPVAETLQLIDGAPAAVFGVLPAQEVVAAEIVVSGLSVEHMPDRDELAVRDRCQPAFAAAARGDAAEEGVQVGTPPADGAQ